MTVAKAPAPERPPAPRGSLVRRAVWAGFLAWLPLAVGGQLLAWTAYLITRSFGPWSWVKVGLANTVAVARVPFEAPADVADRIPAEGSVFGTTSMLSVALGAGTLVMLVMLFRAGRAAVRGIPWRPGVAVTATLAVAFGFAVPMFVSGLLVTLRFPSIGIGVLRPIAWVAFALPFVVGCVVAGGGALAADETRFEVDRVSAAARGAWQTMTWGIVLALLGTVALAAVRPAGSTSYARALERQGAGGAMLAMYHALLVPNQSVDVLATSMGSCTTFSFGDDAVSRVCLGGVDVRDPLLALFVGDPSRDGSRGVAFGPGYLAFLLVPALASIAGGRRAAEGVRTMRERAFRAACAGVGFGVLVGVAAWAATITIDGPEGEIASLGADPVATGTLGVVWGVVGGTLGALVPDRAADVRNPTSSPARPR